MDPIIAKLIEQVPNAAAVILTVYLFLQDRQKAEATRAINAKAFEAERRAHELQINNMWAQFFKNLTDENAKNIKEIVQEIHDHDDASKERYKRMKVTQELRKAASEKTVQREP